MFFASSSGFSLFPNGGTSINSVENVCENVKNVGCGRWQLAVSWNQPYV